MASAADTVSRPGSGSGDHEGFLRHRRFIWAKAAAVLAILATIAYFAADVEPRRNGGSWMGYTLGTLGAGLIVWLALLGIRKRAMTAGNWSLKSWTSAHVYLGLALVVIATLHTGFQLGWNVHTLAYALMMVVVLSGLFGVYAYAALPAALSANRQELTQADMVAGLAALDRQLEDAAQPLEGQDAALLLTVLDDDPFAPGLLRRLLGHYPACATQDAINAFADRAQGDPSAPKIESLLGRRAALLAQMRRHMKIKALLEVWLYIHVPATMALLAALLAHIISVFFYW